MRLPASALLGALSLAGCVRAMPTMSRNKVAVRSSGAVSCSANVTDEPIAPSEDPWYTAPYEFEREAPGTILRVRPAPGNLTTLAGSNCSAAYNILYRTTGSRYDAAWAVTTLLVPVNASVNGSLLSYQIPYDSNWVDASPSYALYGGVDDFLGESLGKGWFVNVPDFEGPLASFTAGVLSGHATLDSVRAVLRNNERFGLPANATYAMWGYSGGALASEWAAELQVQYAPELQFAGAALGGLTPNITSVLYSVNGSPEVGLAPPAILGVTNQFPEAYAYVLSQLKPNGTHNASAFRATENYTLDEDISTYAFQDIADYFKDGFGIVDVPMISKIINSDGQMGYHGVPQMPIYAYKAIKDEISPVNDTDALLDRFCGIGVNILYERNTIGGHSADFYNGLPAAVSFLDSIFGGTYANHYNTTGCTFRDVTVNISTSAF